MDSVLAGSATEWIVTATNAGPTMLSNVTIDDTLPTGYTGWGLVGPTGSFVSGHFLATLPQLAPGNSVTWRLTCTAPSVAGWYKNTVTGHSDQEDSEGNDAYPADNTDIAFQLVYTGAAGSGAIGTGTVSSKSVSRTKYGIFGEYNSKLPAPNVDLDVFREYQVTTNLSLLSNYSSFQTTSSRFPTSQGYAWSYSTFEDRVESNLLGTLVNKRVYTRLDPLTQQEQLVLMPGQFIDPNVPWDYSAHGEGTASRNTDSTSSLPTSTYNETLAFNYGVSWKNHGATSRTHTGWDVVQGDTVSQPTGKPMLSWNLTYHRVPPSYSAWGEWLATGMIDWASATPTRGSVPSTPDDSGLGLYPLYWYGGARPLPAPTWSSPPSAGVAYTTRTKTTPQGDGYVPASWSSSHSNEEGSSSLSRSGTLKQQKVETEQWLNKYPTSQLMSEIKSDLASASFSQRSGKTVTNSISVSSDGWSAHAVEEKVDIYIDPSVLVNGKRMRVVAKPISSYTFSTQVDSGGRSKGWTRTQPKLRPQVLRELDSTSPPQTYTFKAPIPWDYGKVGTGKSSGTFYTKAEATWEVVVMYVDPDDPDAPMGEGDYNGDDDIYDWDDLLGY